MTDMRELPEVVADWLRRNHIALAPPPGERGQAAWAEWDGRCGELLLGVWLEIDCPRCGQSDRPERSLIVPGGFTDNDWQHGCGHWWSPIGGTVPVPDVEDLYGVALEEVLHELDEELAELRAAQRTAVDEVRADLTGQLRRFLNLFPDEEERIEQAGGGETEPGIWRPDGGEWEIWAYDPTGGSDPITVVESDLTGVDAEADPDEDEIDAMMARGGLIESAGPRTPFTPANIVKGDDGRWYHDGEDVTDRPVWWKCGQGHSWEATIGARTSLDDVGCPTCWAAAHI